jgi:hypothetical protein
MVERGGDLAGDIDDRKSTSGTLFFFGDCLVSWQSQKQRVVALSSCESEYIAAATAACQGVWLGRLLGDLLGTDPLVADLHVDNKSAIQLIKNPVFHDRSKHIEVRYHYIRNCAENMAPSWFSLLALKISSQISLQRLWAECVSR